MTTLGHKVFLATGGPVGILAAFYHGPPIGGAWIGFIGTAALATVLVGSTQAALVRWYQRKAPAGWRLFALLPLMIGAGILAAAFALVASGLVPYEPWVRLPDVPAPPQALAGPLCYDFDAGFAYVRTRPGAIYRYRTGHPGFGWAPVDSIPTTTDPVNGSCWTSPTDSVRQGARATPTEMTIVNIGADCRGRTRYRLDPLGAVSESETGYCAVTAVFGIVGICAVAGFLSGLAWCAVGLVGRPAPPVAT